MAAYFLDTSTVVKRYVHETGTAWVQALTDPAIPDSLPTVCKMAHVGFIEGSHEIFRGDVHVTLRGHKRRNGSSVQIRY